MNPGSLPPGTPPGYLVVTPQSLVDAEVFDEFADFKRGLGFSVSIATLETIAATMFGTDLAEQIREYLKRAYQPNTFRPANVRYVLLVGEHDTIPFRQIYPRWESADKPRGLTFTDWYYADLTGDWDSNGDGIFALESDGSLRWRFDAGGPVDSSPALDHTTVFVVGGGHSDAQVFAIDRATGAARWAIAIGGRALWGSSPALGYDQTVYVVASTGQLIAIGPYNTLPAPSAASASAFSDHEVDLRWRDNGLTGNGFSVERRTGFRGDFKSIATLPGSVTSYRDSSVQPNRVYFYRVRALASTPSGYSNETRVRTPRPVPKPLGAVKTRANSAYGIRVSWSRLDPNALGVAVYRGLKPSGPFTRIGIARAGITNFLDVNPRVCVESSPRDGEPQPRHTYYYQLRAFNARGESRAASVAGTTRGLDLTAPTGVVVKVSSGSRVRVSWRNPLRGHEGIVIERSSDARAGFEILATLPARTASFKDVPEPGWLTYRVRAVSETNDSPFATADPIHVAE